MFSFQVITIRTAKISSSFKKKTQESELERLTYLVWTLPHPPGEPGDFADKTRDLSLRDFFKMGEVKDHYGLLI